MLQAHASQITLHCAADYMLDPASYELLSTKRQMTRYLEVFMKMSDHIEEVPDAALAALEILEGRN